MAYNLELVKQLLGDKLAEFFDGTVTIEPSNEIINGLRIGDKLTFKLKNPIPTRQFVVSWDKK